VPGALLRCRLALKPDGLLLGCFIGEGSLPRLRAALSAGEQGRVVARMHPQIDVRGFGDLIRSVGLALPVIDIDRMMVAWRRLAALVRDLRASALTSVLSGPVIPLRRSAWQAAQAHFDAGDGEVLPETIAIVHFSGWAPHPDQPQPARRGSATASLAAALKARPDGH
jgi:NADH dehydrogenase [ubiquinone] 1 alpha subcomplex assembly factor 5